MTRPHSHNLARYWRDPALPGLSLLHADFSRHDYAPHSHDALVVAVTEDGGSEFKARGRTEEATPGVTLVFNPDEPHSGRMGRSRRWHYRSFYLERPAIAALQALLEIERDPYFCGSLLPDPAIADAFRALHHALDGPAEPFAVRERLVAAFGLLFARAEAVRRPASAPRDQALLQRATALMQERYAENLTLDAIGAEIGLTPFQLIGLFRRTAGFTPHAYLTQIRLAAAIRHLRTGSAPAEAASAAGFYDQSALNRHFRRVYGITPGQFTRAA